MAKNAKEAATFRPCRQSQLNVIGKFPPLDWMFFWEIAMEWGRDMGAHFLRLRQWYRAKTQ